MKKLFTILAAVLITAGVFAQSPEKMSYQAVIRNSSDQLVTDQAIGMQISILQGTADGSPVYVETQTPTTNDNGLVSIEIGDGTVLNGDFSTIDWANGPYFIKTETDPAGGTSYTITGTSQLLSVPYALHAKTAETAAESDPLFSAWDKSTGISVTESQISDLGNYIETETDPTIPQYIKDIESTEITNWNEAYSWGDHAQAGYLTELSAETDPTVPAHVKSITTDNVSDWNEAHNWGDHSTEGYLIDYTVTETDVTTHQTALSVTESQISDLGTYIETETDPAVAANFDFTDAANGDLLQFNGTKWVKVTPDYISDYTVTEGDVTAHETALTVTESQISDLGTYIETEIQNLDHVLTQNNSAGNKNITNLADPVNDQDAVTKAYLDAFLDQLYAEGALRVRDADGNYYNTVKIGDQIWMAENLKTTKYNDNTPIPLVTDETTWKSLSSDAYCWYNNNISNKDIYGALYNWYTVNTGKLCPVGWHVASDTEWSILENYLIANGYNFDGTTTGNKIAKSLASTTNWTSSAVVGAVGNTDYPIYRNKTNFSAMPGGLRYSMGSTDFDFLDIDGAWWTSTEASTHGVSRYFFNSQTSLNNSTNPKGIGFSVRCIRD